MDKMNSSALESRDHGLEITTLALALLVKALAFTSLVNALALLVLALAFASGGLTLHVR